MCLELFSCICIWKWAMNTLSTEWKLSESEWSKKMNILHEINIFFKKKSKKFQKLKCDKIN